MVGLVKRMPVKDCPDHPASALQLAAGVFCFGCGREVVDHGLVLTTEEPSERLVDEAKREWQGNLTVAAFGVEAQLAARGMIESATDG